MSNIITFDCIFYFFFFFVECGFHKAILIETKLLMRIFISF